MTRGGTDGATSFPMLLSPIAVGPVTIRNRIVSSGHATRLADGQIASERFRAYHRARAAGGAGLIITEASMTERSSSYSPAQLVCADDSVIESFRQLTDEIHEEGATIFGQLLHLGLEHARDLDGLRAVAWGPTAGSSERYHTAGRAMSEADIERVVESFAAAAERMRAGGFDGVEIAASHGYLLAQFLSSTINTRTDRWGGSAENRMRLLRTVIERVRAAIGPDLALGLRISGDEMTTDGLDGDAVVDICAQIGADGLIDWFNIPIGSSRQIGGAIHIVSPMSTEMAISVPVARRVRAVVDQPVLAVGRINTARQAEALLAEGDVDLCGMTRALICDPEMPNKIGAARPDDVRVCIACNQACIDRFHRGHGISCIQHPETGRETRFGVRVAARTPRSVAVVGGGPAGMKAAAVAAERGHHVTLFDAATRLGGQVKLAELLPRRSEFGGLIENLQREVEAAGVIVKMNTRVSRALLDDLAPDVVVVATGARPRTRDVGEVDEAHVVSAWDVLNGVATPGRRVLVSDWTCDWIGPGIAEALAIDRHRVTLASTGHVAGETLPRYVRDHTLAELHRHEIETIPLARFFGADADTVWLQHMTSGLPIVVEDIDTVVMCAGHLPDTTLESELDGFDADVHVIGDCRAVRTAEEAIHDGLVVGSEI